MKRGAEVAYVGTAALGCPVEPRSIISTQSLNRAHNPEDSRGRLSPHGLCLQMSEVAVESVLSG